MTETLAPVEASTNVMFGFYDDRGNFTVKPIGYRQDETGKEKPFFKGDEYAIQHATEMVETWRTRLYEEAVGAIKDVPRADAGALHLDRIDHFYNALGLPCVPTVVVADARDLPVDGPFQGYTQHFRNDRGLVGAYFDTPRLLIAAEKTITGHSDHDLEHNIVHEKAHSTGLTTVVLMPMPGGDLRAAVVRNGFKVINPITREHVDDLKERNERPEEAQAEMFAGVYAELFLDRPDTISIRKGAFGTGDLMEIDGKYTQDPATKNVSSSTPLALALELLIEQDPNILEQLLESRVSINGLRGFAQAINAQMPGLYAEFVWRRVGWMSNNFLLDSVVNTLYGGDRDVLKKTGSAVTSFVVGKLQAYEQQTGYNFGLPASVTQGAVLLNPGAAGPPAPAVTASGSSKQTSGDEITVLLNQVRDTL